MHWEVRFVLRQLQAAAVSTAPRIGVGWGTHTARDEVSTAIALADLRQLENDAHHPRVDLSVLASVPEDRIDL